MSVFFPLGISTLQWNLCPSLIQVYNLESGGLRFSYKKPCLMLAFAEWGQMFCNYFPSYQGEKRAAVWEELLPAVLIPVAENNQPKTAHLLLLFSFSIFLFYTDRETRWNIFICYLFPYSILLQSCYGYALTVKYWCFNICSPSIS